jgi:transcriptional regulator with XRE-family HTH domain
MKSLHDRIYERFVASLKKARVDAGVTQAGLASQLGTDQSYVSKYERRERRLDYVEVRSICLALKLDPAKFIKTFEDSVEAEGGGK